MIEWNWISFGVGFVIAGTLQQWRIWLKKDGSIRYEVQLVKSIQKYCGDHGHNYETKELFIHFLEHESARQAEALRVGGEG